MSTSLEALTNHIASLDLEAVSSAVNQEFGMGLSRQQLNEAGLEYRRFLLLHSLRATVQPATNSLVDTFLRFHQCESPADLKRIELKANGLGKSIQAAGSNDQLSYRAVYLSDPSKPWHDLELKELSPAPTGS